MKTAHEKIIALQNRLKTRGIELTYHEVYKLRLAEFRLHRWCEQECGDSNAHASFCIERDEKTNKPFRVTYPNNGKSFRSPIHDREAGALRTIRKICDGFNLFWHYQTDPRGCALYISKEKMTDSNYSSIGYAVCD